MAVHPRVQLFLNGFKASQLEIAILADQEIFDVRRFGSYLPLFALALACAPFANAQAGFDIGVGFGGSRAPAAKTGIDTNLQNCILGTPGCQSTPDLNSFMMGFKFDLMAWNK